MTHKGTVIQALAHYDFTAPSAELIRHNENITYKITDNGKWYVLRIHKPVDGFNLDFLRMRKINTELIAGEIELLLHLEKNGYLPTQKVKRNIHGGEVTVLEDKTPVTVLEWIEGITLENIEITKEIAYKTGLMIGKMHNSFEDISIPTRYRYDGKLLLRMVDEAQTALNQGHFSTEHAKIMTDTLLYAENYLTKENSRFILVHSDLGKSNIIYNDNNVVPIDFSLSGYCIPEMDLASIYSHVNDDTLNREILNGYKSVCKYEPQNRGIDICFCLQILLFLISQHNKIAGQPWLDKKMDKWCEERFIPLIRGE